MRGWPLQLRFRRARMLRCRASCPQPSGKIIEPMTNLIQQGLALRELLRERILILDGAMGTMLQQANLTADGFWRPASGRLQRKSGADAGRTWCWASTANICDAGSDIIETNSFGSTPVVLAEYGLGEQARTKSAAWPRNWRAKPRTNFPTRASRDSWRVPWDRRRKRSASPAESRSSSFAIISTSRRAG